MQAVVEQHWRQEEDGTFIVFMHSVRHHAAREAPLSYWSWYTPIRADVSGPPSFSPPAHLPTICLSSYASWTAIIALVKEHLVTARALRFIHSDDQWCFWANGRFLWNSFAI